MLRMIAAAVFVFNFLVNIRLKQINLPAYVLSTYKEILRMIGAVVFVFNFLVFPLTIAIIKGGSFGASVRTVLFIRVTDVL